MEIMSAEADEIIWQKCLTGDRKAFEELYNRYYAMLYNYGRKFSSDVELVKDCIQNFFVKLIRNHEHLSTTASVKSYLLKAFRYTLYNALEAKKQRNDFILPCLDDLLSSNSDLLPSALSDSFPNDYSSIHQALKTLPSRQQEILYLYFALELEHSEIASLLNINYQSSKNLLYRALLKLKSILVKEDLVSCL
ncbi:MAG: sigma-70 family RNA polymerase sigma factor [Parabacteroides sp.]|nr:sigma-70 family RNA polymerase sigma factor [Parabacteroides sp.]